MHTARAMHQDNEIQSCLVTSTGDRSRKWDPPSQLSGNGKQWSEEIKFQTARDIFIKFSFEFLQSFLAFPAQLFSFPLYFFGQLPYGRRIRSLPSTVVCDLFVNAGLGSARRDKRTCHCLMLFRVLFLLSLTLWPDLWNKLIR